MALWWIVFAGILAIGMFMFAGWLGWFRKPGELPRVEALCPGMPADGQGLPRIEWLGHSSYRVEWGGKVLLMDPVLSRRVSIAPRLMETPPAEVLTGADAILVSHAHMDHLDNATLGRIQPCDLYLPRKSEGFLNRIVRARHRVLPFERDAVIEIGPLTITVVAARHGGWRYPWQRGYFACGFVIHDGSTALYYAGDTAWGEHFESIREQFHPDIAILPIGGYSPRWFLKSRHLNPPEAVKAARILGSRWSIPGHFGTYRVSMEAMAEPLEWFRREQLNR
jgi:L-ascorbate metabolism protein UlaG (beta-lactamase superfamily)